MPMTKLEKIEQDIASLGKDDLAKLSAWLAEYNASRWDEQFEADVKAGRLDRMGEKALAEHRAGRTRPL